MADKTDLEKQKTDDSKIDPKQGLTITCISFVLMIVYVVF